MELSKEIPAGGEEILAPAALDFVATLESHFGNSRRKLLARREERQARYDEGELPGFDPATEEIRCGDWQVKAPPTALEDRRVEITGPCDRKMIINALNSGAKVFMADLEDSHSPVWAKTVAGQVNLHDAVKGTISFQDPATGKNYALRDSPAELMVRPRGWHLDEPALSHHGSPVSASLFDFGIFFFNNAARLAEKAKGPFFYLPKIEHWEEAGLWAEVIAFAEKEVGIAAGTTKVTLLIETFPAVFCMHEILHALRDNIVGLNCGRWDYIFSYIKTLRAHAKYMLPERNQVNMEVPFLDAYSKLLVQTCHRRNAHAMGGMSACIPVRNDEKSNAEAFANVASDKRREASNGHDGTWVAHPGLVDVAQKVFDEALASNRSQKQFSPSKEISAADLIEPATGTITMAGFDLNIQVALRYISAWLGGVGAVPIFNLMEDAATAEISRSQLWQWVQTPDVATACATPIDARLFGDRLAAALADIPGSEPGELILANLDAAAELLRELVLSAAIADFLTIPAQQRLG